LQKKWRALYETGLKFPKELNYLKVQHYLLTYLSLFIHVICPFLLLDFVSFLTVATVHWIVMGGWYFLAVAPNHDQIETMENNENNTSSSGIPKIQMDWGEHQVRASGNHSIFSPFWAVFFNWIFGGLNYQIEHHLFPAISHSHYPEISSLVQKTCEEFQIPYQGKNSFVESLCSVNNFLQVQGSIETPLRQNPTKQ